MLAMQPSTPRPVHIRRIDPERNMRRFYLLAIQPDLFGGAALVRNWGRICTSGQTMVETFDHPNDATVAFDRLLKAKRRKGYIGVPD
jgi:predicted DNA-binding WGR domain protein